MTLAPPDALIGRGPEIELLGGLISRVTGGAAATVLIEGEAGIGKTRLLSSLIEAAHERGVAVFGGEAHLLERTRPFGALAQALELRRGSGDPRRAAIGRLLAPEAAVDPGTPPAGALQFRAVEQIIDLIEGLTDHSPVLVALDDLHWADSSTLLAFRSMTRELTQVPLLLVATLRPLPRSAELGQLLDDCVESGAEVVRLEALEESAVNELVGTELGLPPSPTLAEAVRRAGGNPLWVVEMVRSMSSEGMLDLSGQSAELAGAELPDSLHQLVVRRLSYLPEGTVAALTSASLLGDAFSVVDLATVTGRPARDLVADLSDAFAAGLLADGGDVLVFRHQLVRDAIYEQLPEAARIALHRDAGRALAAAGAPLAQVASHIVLGAVAGDVEGAQALRRAAGEAAPRAPRIAVDLLRRVDSLLPPGHAERDGVRAELVQSLLRSGEISQAAAIAEEVLGRPHDDDVDGSVRIGLIDALSILNRGEDLVERTEAALAENPAMPLADQALIVAQGSLGRTFSDDFVGGERTGRQALEIAEQAGDLAMTVWSLTTLAVAVKTQGRYGEALALTERAVQIAIDAPDDRPRMRQPYFIHGMVLCDCDRLDDARLAFRAAAGEAGELESAWLLPDIHLVMSELGFLLGDWEEAALEFQGGIETARERGNVILMSRMHAYLGFIAAARGNLKAAELALGPVQGDLVSERPRFGAEFVAYADSLCHEVAGRPADALDVLRRFWHHDTAHENRYGVRFMAPALVRLALAQEEHSLALEVTEGAAQAAALAADVPSVQSAALRCRGLVEHDPEAMQAAVELARRARRVLELAGACEDAAFVLGALDRAADAQVLLAEALDRYEAIGADWYGSRAYGALRALGARRGRRGPRGRPLTGWESLTRSERAVAELVAEGMTNREVGKRLFISPHTVNSHLRHSFQKLDVSTRAALAAKAGRARID